MTWKFDQPPNGACFTCRNVVEGHPVLVVTHYEDDHSWAFLDGQPVDISEALLVAMSQVISRHPDLDDIADLPPGWSASRAAIGDAWLKTQSDWPLET